MREVAVKEGVRLVKDGVHDHCRPSRAPETLMKQADRGDSCDWRNRSGASRLFVWQAGFGVGPGMFRRS